MNAVLLEVWFRASGAVEKTVGQAGKDEVCGKGEHFKDIMANDHMMIPEK